MCAHLSLEAAARRGLEGSGCGEVDQVRVVIVCGVGRVERGTREGVVMVVPDTELLDWGDE